MHKIIILDNMSKVIVIYNSNENFSSNNWSAYNAPLNKILFLLFIRVYYLGSNVWLKMLMCRKNIKILYMYDQNIPNSMHRPCNLNVKTIEIWKCYIKNFTIIIVNIIIDV
jgi:hypothetical protein